MNSKRDQPYSNPPFDLQFFLGEVFADFFSPHRYAPGRATNLVDEAPNHCVDDRGQGSGATVEGGNRRQNNRASLKQSHDVAGVNQIPRRFPGDKNQFPSFLQEDIGRTQENAVARTGSVQSVPA